MHNTISSECKRNRKDLLTKERFLVSSSKAFDCLPHDVTVVKLNRYESSLLALKLISYYLPIRITRTNSSYSSWESILFGVPHGSILHTSLYIYFLSHSFLVIDDIDCACYADDNFM